MANCTSKSLSLALILTGTLFQTLPSMSGSAWGQDLSLETGDNIAYIGNTTADRMQHHAWLETYLHALHPDHQLTFRNLGFSGDEVKTRPRSANFGTPDQWLTKVGADTVFCFFGYNEALRGDTGLQQFKTDLAGMLDGMAAQKYNGESAPKVVVFSPIAHENLNSRHLPDGSSNNANLELYTNAMRDVCTEKAVPFVDLFELSQELYATADLPLTMNGVHLLDHGNRALARAVLPKLIPGSQAPADSPLIPFLKRWKAKNLNRSCWSKVKFAARKIVNTTAR